MCQTDICKNYYSSRDTQLTTQKCCAYGRRRGPANGQLMFESLLIESMHWKWNFTPTLDEQTKKTLITLPAGDSSVSIDFDFNSFP